MLLSDGRSVTAFAYQEEREIRSALDRALRLMTEAGAHRFDVIGFSIGGWFAQCLAAEQPERVRKLVLAHSFTLGPNAAWRFRVAALLWRILPRALVRAGIMKRARLALTPLKGTDRRLYDITLQRVWEAISSEDARKRLVAQQQAVHDSLLKSGGRIPTQPVLIVESANDPLIGLKDRAELRRKFPDAQSVVLPQAGHVSALSAPGALAAAVDAFLRT